jgi:hypothetical protein
MGVLELIYVTEWKVYSDLASNLGKLEVICKQINGTSMQEK